MMQNESKKIKISGDPREYYIVNGDRGRCLQISIVTKRVQRERIEPRNPITLSALLDLKYEDGTVDQQWVSPQMVLFYGFCKAYTEDGERGIIMDKPIIAAIAREMANLNPFEDGDIPVPTEDDAEKIIIELGIPYPAIGYETALKERKYTEVEWMLKWKRSGKLCYMGDLDEYEIETTIPPGRKDCIQYTGEQVAIRAQNEEIDKNEEREEEL